MMDKDREVADATGTRAVNWVVSGTLDGLEFGIRYFACTAAEAKAMFQRRYRRAENVRVEKSLF